jgi:hypothetical protein
MSCSKIIGIDNLYSNNNNNNNKVLSMTKYIGLCIYLISLILILINHSEAGNEQVIGVVNSFNMAVANTSVWLSAAAYCDTNDYLTRTYKGPSTGFIPYLKIDEKKYDTQGFIGYLSSQKKIYVVFRGSTSIEDWIEDLSELLCDYTYYNGQSICSDCVHCGFQETEKQVYPEVLDGVKKLHEMSPDYEIIITGHSLGAALATLVSIDLIHENLGFTIAMQNFGSPRIGDDNFVKFASSIISDRSRNTHYKDIVPHVPIHYRYTHISGEWYENTEEWKGSVKACSGYEDPQCSYQWHITSIDDHMHYLGLYMGCEDV